MIRARSKWRLGLKAKRGIRHPPDKLVGPPRLARGLEDLGMKWLYPLCNFGRC